MKNKRKIYAFFTAVSLLLIILGFNYFSNIHGLTCQDMSSICGMGNHGIVQLAVGILLVVLVMLLIVLIFENNNE